MAEIRHFSFWFITDKRGTVTTKVQSATQLSALAGLGVNAGVRFGPIPSQRLLSLSNLPSEASSGVRRP
jgi:hypothetical protein